MDQEKIGNFIKKIRKDNNLSQKGFAEKLGVSFQAVSKWENGKNLPDISTLKEIKKQFNVNIDEIIEGNISSDMKNIKHKNIIFIIILIFILVGLLILINSLLKNRNQVFEFNELNSMNRDFSVSGSVVKTNDRIALLINNVNYKGENEDTIYDEVSCVMYEEKTKEIKEIAVCDTGNNLSLLDYLEDLKIRMDNQTSSCTMFKTSSIYIEIRAKEKNNKTIVYKIPIDISDENCD